MFVRTISACVLVVAFLAHPGLGAAQQPRSITLTEALTAAGANNPDVRAAEAEVAVARGRVAAAQTFAYNPELSVTAGPAHSADTSLTSYQFGLRQTVELGGKRGARGRNAEGLLAAADARLERQRQQAIRRAERAYVLAVLARARVVTAVEAEAVAAQLKRAADERLELGSGTRLEVNVAVAALGRERRARFEAERAEASALLELGGVVGLAPSDAVVPASDLASILRNAAAPSEPRTDDQPSVETFVALRAPIRLSEDSLVQLALAQRQDLAAVRAEREAADASLSLARALAIPDPSFGVSAGKAEDFNVVYFSFSLPLPLWNRGQGARAQAAASVEQARLAEARVRRDVERDVRETYRGYVKSRAAEAAFDRDAVERLDENLALASESFRAGKVGLLAFNTIRRDLVEARLAYLDALADVVERHTALELAIGGSLE